MAEYESMTGPRSRKDALIAESNARRLKLGIDLRGVKSAVDMVDLGVRTSRSALDHFAETSAKRSSHDGGNHRGDWLDRVTQGISIAQSAMRIWKEFRSGQ
jgi:hypothetical protein